jgi:hypothetical protein
MHFTVEEQAKKIERRRSRDPGWLYVGLGVLTFIVFSPLLGSQFLAYGDPSYVTNNAHVQGGLNASNIAWAFSTTDQGAWMPLTWISHMLDVSIFGLSSAGHHLTNILLHIANTLLLFFVLNRMTGALWRCGIVAILFALHPVHVESVAWIAERKGLLGAFFVMLTFYAYAFYASKPDPARYVLVIFPAALALMCGPGQVMLPLMLLILDFWPLRRTFMAAKRHKSKRRIDRAARYQARSMPVLLAEKIPFAAMSLAVCAVTMRARFGSWMDSGHGAFGQRVDHALIAYLNYIWMFIFPHDLSVFYPSIAPSRAGAIAAGLVLFVVSWMVLSWARRKPYLFSGWFWFVATLLPMVGFVWIGDQEWADRYTYLPLIGLFIVIAWSSAELAKRYPILKGIASVIAIAPMVATCIQVKFWKDTHALFEHAVDADPGNYMAYTMLGDLRQSQSEAEQAVQLYSSALHCAPDDAHAADIHLRLGRAFEREGKLAEAQNEYQAAHKLNPGANGFTPPSATAGQEKKI